jgi:hypothetical protein
MLSGAISFCLVRSNISVCYSSSTFQSDSATTSAARNIASPKRASDGSAKKKKRVASDAESKEANDAATTRLERKRFQEKRRRKEFREALDTLLAALIRHDQDFGKEARIRETRMAGRLSYRSPLSEDNPLFNRVEMVNQANFTIERLTEEGNVLKKTLESLGGSLEKIKAAQKLSGTSYEAPVFHQGVGPLASHQVPPIVPDMEPTEEGLRKKARSVTSISASAGSPNARPRNSSSVPPDRGPHALPTSGLMHTVMGGLFGATANSHHNVHLQQRQQQELLWMHHQQMQMDGQRRMLLGHHSNHQQQPTSSIGELQAFLANQHNHTAAPHRTGLPNGGAGHLGGPTGFSAQAYELAVVSRMLGRQPHPPPMQQQPQAAVLDPESQYHRAVSNFQPMAVQSQHQLSARAGGLGGAPFSFHVDGSLTGGRGVGESTAEHDRASSDDASEESAGTEG